MNKAVIKQISFYVYVNIILAFILVKMYNIGRNVSVELSGQNKSKL